MKLGRTLCILVLVCILVLMAGCNNKEDAAGEVVSANSQGEILAIPERAPDLMGRVVEVIGNEVTVYKIQVNPNRGTGEGERPKGKDAGDAPGQAPQSSTANRMPQMTVSEEKEAFIIPVGTPIVMMQRGNSQVNLVELTEIKKDQIIRVWKSEDTVELVQLIAAGARGNGNRQNGGQGGFPGGGFPPGGMGGGPQ